MTVKQAKRFLIKGDLAEISRKNGWNYDYFIQVSRGVRNNSDMEKAIIQKGKSRKRDLLKDVL